MAFRLSRKPDDPGDTMGYFDPGRIFITINRGDYWQCGHVVPKGEAEEVRRHLDRGSELELVVFAVHGAAAKEAFERALA